MRASAMPEAPIQLVAKVNAKVGDFEQMLQITIRKARARDARIASSMNPNHPDQVCRSSPSARRQSQQRIGTVALQLRALGTPPPPAKTLSQAAPDWAKRPLVQPKQSCVGVVPEEIQP